jgi:hypothetical protein
MSSLILFSFKTTLVILRSLDFHRNFRITLSNFAKKSANFSFKDKDCFKSIDDLGEYLLF